MEPRPRPCRKDSGVLPPALVEHIRQGKIKDPGQSVPELVEQAVRLGIVEGRPHRSTVHRVCRRLGIPVDRRKTSSSQDTRRFAYPHRMDMVLCDGVHFRAGASRAKRVAFFFLDDATRYALHVVVGTSENEALFLRGLYELVCRHGWMTILYLDKGSGFIGHDTIAILGHGTPRVALVHGRTRYPEGHGKIEAFNRSARGRVLRTLNGKAEVDPDCGALELRLAHYIREEYNTLAHEGIGKMIPRERFLGDERPLRVPEDRDALRDRFVVTLKRRVSADHIVSIEGIHYEMPAGYAGARVQLSRKAIEGGIFLFHQGHLIELHPVDLAANARARRGRGDQAPESEAPLPHPELVEGGPPSAAEISFNRDHDPITAGDGGYPEDDDEEEEAPWIF